MAPRQRLSVQARTATMRDELHGIVVLRLDGDDESETSSSGR
jgi:hypothetical protein